MLSLRHLLTLASVFLALIVAAGSSSPASAASANLGIDHDGGSADINSGPATVVAGASVNVRLITEAAPPGIGALSLNVVFDDSVLDGTACVVTFPAGGACNPNFTADSMRVAHANALGTSGTVAGMTMTFQALGVAGECSDLVLVVDELIDPSFVPLTPEVRNGSICIAGCADLNGDGFVSLRDAIRLLLHIVLGRPYDAAFDLNGDGLIDRSDLAELARQAGTSC